MQFTIANRVFQVVIHPRPIVRGGKPREAWLDAVGGRILISSEVPRDARRRLLFHELRHAHVNLLGRPADDDESEAANVSAFMDDMLSQFEAEGGDGALVALNPAADSVPKTSSGVPIRDRQQCGRCRSDVMAGSIIPEPPVWNDEFGCWTMSCGMQCECGAITTWTEQASEAGTPLGVVLRNPPPRVLSLEEAKQWVIEHEARLLMLAR